MKVSAIVSSALAACLFASNAFAVTFLELTVIDEGLIPPPKSFGTLGIHLGMKPDEVEKIAMQEGYKKELGEKNWHCLGEYCVKSPDGQKHVYSFKFEKPGSRIYVDFDHPILGGKAIKIVRQEAHEHIDVKSVSAGMKEKLGNPAGNKPDTPHGDYCWAAKDGKIVKNISSYECNIGRMGTKDARYTMSLFSNKMEIEIEDMMAQKDQRDLRDIFRKKAAREKNKIKPPATTPKL